MHRALRKQLHRLRRGDTDGGFVVYSDSSALGWSVYNNGLQTGGVIPFFFNLDYVPPYGMNSSGSQNMDLHGRYFFALESFGKRIVFFDSIDGSPQQYNLTLPGYAGTTGGTVRVFMSSDKIIAIEHGIGSSK